MVASSHSGLHPKSPWGGLAIIIAKSCQIPRASAVQKTSTSSERTVTAHYRTSSRRMSSSTTFNCMTKTGNRIRTCGFPSSKVLIRRFVTAIHLSPPLISTVSSDTPDLGSDRGHLRGRKVLLNGGMPAVDGAYGCKWQRSGKRILWMAPGRWNWCARAA